MVFQGQVDVYQLKPNVTYVFRVWAENKYGPSSTVEVTATTQSAFRDEGKYMNLLFLFNKISL